MRTDVGGAPSQVVHVRDVLDLADGHDLAEAARPVTVLPGAMTVVAAFSAMRDEGTQLSLVERGDGSCAVVTVTDVLTHLLAADEVNSPN